MELELEDDVKLALDLRAEEKGFGSTQEYVEDLLRQVAEKLDVESADKTGKLRIGWRSSVTDNATQDYISPG